MITTESPSHVAIPRPFPSDDSRALRVSSSHWPARIVRYGAKDEPWTGLPVLLSARHRPTGRGEFRL
jgi:hypothetical protein